MMEWKREKLGAYCNIISGYAFKSQDLKSEGDIPIIKIGTISNGGDLIIDDSMQFVSSEFLKLNTKFHVFYGDVLISLTGSHINNPNSVVGKSCRNYSKKLYLLNQRAGKIVANHSDCLNYIFYLLQSKSIKENIATRAYGAANQANVSPFDILGIKCEFPSIKAMKVIGDYLSKYDLLIQTNNKRIRIMEQMAENLYKEWFVRFRFPGHEKAEFENGLPKGWRIEHIGDVCDTLGGGTPSTNKPEYWNGNIKWVTPTDITTKNSLPLLNIEGRITEEGLKNSSAKLLSPYTILMTSRASIGYFGLAPFPVCTNQGFISIIPNMVNMRMYIIHNLMTRKDEIIMNANGATFLEISKGRFRKMKIVVPDDNTLEAFEKIASDIFMQVLKIEKQSTLLSRQRDLLLPRLMSGKLEVKC